MRQIHPNHFSMFSGQVLSTFNPISGGVKYMLSGGGLMFFDLKNDKTILPYIFEDLIEGLEPMRPPQPPKKPISYTSLFIDFFI